MLSEEARVFSCVNVIKNQNVKGYSSFFFFLINLGMFISFLVSSRIQSLFSSVLLNLHRFVNVLGFLLLFIYSLIPVRSDRIQAISISLYLLRLGLCPTLWSISEIVPWSAKKYVYSAVWMKWMFYIYLLSTLT